VAGAILAFGDVALEVGVGNRVVLRLDGEPLDRRVGRRLLRDRPALEDAIDLEAQVVVEARGVVLLDDEDRVGVVPFP
jgi:hypothetical protein